MISLQEIKKHYSGLDGFERSILREYLQYKILDIIFKSKISHKLSFLGGTAIKICFNSSRFSEDLDFDNFDLSEDDFTRLTKIIEKELTAMGYEVEIKNVFKGAFRCYIKIPKLLHENNLAAMPEEKIVVQVDTAPHNFVYKPDSYILQKFDVFRSIRLTPKDIILSQKIGAIMGRKRDKGRDYFDVLYLLGQSDFNYEYLEFKLGIKNKSELKKTLLKKTKNIDFKALLRDVRPFILRPGDEERILSFREYIKQRL